MESIKEKNRHSNPRETASIWSILSFRFTLPIFQKGTQKNLQEDDLYKPLQSDKSNVLGNRFQRNWTKQTSNSKSVPSLLLALFQTFWMEYVELGVVAGVSDILVRLSQPYLLGCMLQSFIAETSATGNDALLYALGIVVLKIFSVFVTAQYKMYGMHLGMRVRVAVCSLIYRKALKLNKTSIGRNPVGKIVNMLSNDVSRFDSACLILHDMWICPISAIIIMRLIFKEVGFAGAAGVVAITAIVPIQAYLSRLSAKYREKIAQKTDQRIRLMDEVIHGIQLIKMYAWEKSFEKLVGSTRNDEIEMLRKGAYTKAVFMAFNLFNNTFALFVTLATMALTNQAITAARVFVFLSYYQMLGKNLSSVFVSGITQLAELYVSVKRLQDFLNSDEYTPSQEACNYSNDEKEVIIWKNVNATWNTSSSENLVLENINLRVTKGELIGIIGPVGSGKSSLLQSLLGELHILQGHSKYNGTFSYASQDPWIFGATIRQNVVFGSEFNAERYNEVIRVCDLEKDFDQFAEGDLTILGDTGASLSGGQKARVNLARAVYKEADIYLLDDPLSAVDVHVSKKLFDLCINGFLGGKTRLLVTHQVHYLKDSDEVIILNNGRVENRGKYQELAEADQPYAKLLTIDNGSPDESIRKVNLKQESPVISENVCQTMPKELEQGTKDKNEPSMSKQKEPSEGRVTGSLLLYYLSSGMDYYELFFIFSLMCVAQGSNNLIDWFVSFWTDVEEHKSVKNPIVSGYIWTTGTFICLYGGLVVFCLVTTLSRSTLFHKYLLRCSSSSHTKLFNRVIHTNLGFFDSNPSGKILNRFSKDIVVIDETLPKLLFDASRIFLKMVGHLIIIIYVNPYVILPVMILALMFTYIRNIYLKSSKNLKRLEARNKSPVFTHLTSRMQGLTTIRAFHAENILIEEFDTYQDYHTSAWFMLISTSAAFEFALDFICASFSGSLVLGLVGLSDCFCLTGAEIGLAISQANALTGNLQFLVRFSADISNQLMSVERVLEYQSLPPEIQPKNPKTPSNAWPNTGNINISNVNFRYSKNGPKILNNININIEPREKIGVVGRTGSGKSSLIAAIFRLATVEGKIEIDGINTEDISLENLRSKISIIPQDPILFSGTLKHNIDPFEYYSDEVLEKALEEVELRDASNNVISVTSKVMDRGSNYSVGQRQLICLARAIIRNNKILIMDEATANVDPRTDALIQETIRQRCGDCTVLTIAHRLNTIMNSDKILVIDDGKVAEFDHPYKLLQNRNGFLYKMVTSSGTAVSEKFFESAERNYKISILSQLTE